MTLRRPTLKDLFNPDISSLDLYIGKHNAKMALIAPASWKKHVYSLRHEWNSQYETSIDAATIHAEGPVYRLDRPPITNIQGLKFFDEQRIDKISIATFETFRHRFHRFTGGILEDLDFYKIVVAGGFVPACLIPTPGGGFHPSIFVVAATKKQANAKLLPVEAILRRNVPDFDNAFKVVRSPASVTFAPILGPATLKYRKVQVILVLYRNVVDVISHFDVDHTALAYDGDTFWIAPRAARAFWLVYSILSDAIRSSTAPRLLKYADRGFGLLLQVGQDIQGESRVALQNKVANERRHVMLIYDEAATRYISLKQEPLINVVEDERGHQFELCKWSIYPSNMCSAAPDHAMAPHIGFLKKATMLTAWVVRCIDNGAPWDEIRHGKTLQQMVENDINTALGTAANFKKWITA
ncbi:hypothetical protein CF326_g8805 [Tilletia indica]|nr:hypothetical protein CF326_g8805 [Tilletia indica]